MPRKYNIKECIAMTFEEIVEKARTKAEKADVSGVKFLAVQINLEGEGGGVFYIAVKDGKVDVQPYEYNDRSCAITMNIENFNKLIEGKLDPVVAFTTGKLKVEGDVSKALEFSKLIKKK